MGYKETPAIKTGRALGVFRLNELIRDVQSDDQQTRNVALRALKRGLGCKGSVAGVLRYAREVLAEVKNW